METSDNLLDLQKAPAVLNFPIKRSTNNVMSNYVATPAILLHGNKQMA